MCHDFSYIKILFQRFFLNYTQKNVLNHKSEAFLKHFYDHLRQSKFAGMAFSWNFFFGLWNLKDVSVHEHQLQLQPFCRVNVQLRQEEVIFQRTPSSCGCCRPAGPFFQPGPSPEPLWAGGRSNPERWKDLRTFSPFPRRPLPAAAAPPALPGSAGGAVRAAAELGSLLRRRRRARMDLELCLPHPARRKTPRQGGGAAVWFVLGGPQKVGLQRCVRGRCQVELQGAALSPSSHSLQKEEERPMREIAVRLLKMGGCWSLSVRRRVSSMQKLKTYQEISLITDILRLPFDKRPKNFTRTAFDEFNDLF